MGRIFLILVLVASVVLVFHSPLEQAWNKISGPWPGSQSQAMGEGGGVRERVGDWLMGGRLNQVQSELAALRNEVPGLRQQMDTLQSLRGEVTGLRGEVTGLHGEVTGLRGEVSTLRSDVTSLRQQLDLLHQQLAQITTSHDTLLQPLRTQVDEMATGMPPRIEALERQRESVNAEIARLTRADWRIEQGNLLVEKQDDNWKLTDVFFKRRTYRKAITFSTPFSQIPVVHLGMTSLDFAVDEGRMQVSAEEIQPQGFTLVVESQSSERIRTVGVQWTVFGH
ncbi:MAG: hypothetical protein HQL83_09365 [Magnetococcales bacterium]|nr:hypothetical protein [Magnetococcales bacterium]